MRRSLSRGDLGSLSKKRKRSVSRVRTFPPRPISYAASAIGAHVASAGFPASSRLIKLRYCEEITINPTIGGTSGYVYSANGLYDPNITGSGHQPMGFDQWMGIYGNYTVKKSRIKVQYVPDVASSAAPSAFALLVASTSSVNSTWTANLEQSTCSSSTLAGITSQSLQCHVRGTVDVSKFFDVSDVEAEDDLRGTASANPTKQAYYQILAYGPNTTESGAHNYLVTIEYDVIFTTPSFLAQS